MKAGARRLAVWLDRHRTKVLWAVAALAVAARLAALFGIGALRHPVNFDEGAYFSAAAILGRGGALHRDVTVVHPPATSYVLAPLTFLGDPSTAFVAARCAMAAVGGLSVLLIGKIVTRFAPVWAAVAAGLTYVANPDAALAERSVVLEPLLNLACLAAAFVWLRPADLRDGAWRRRVWATGALLGLAVAFKFWAVLLLVPIAATTTPGRRWGEIWRLLAGAQLSGLVLALPVFVRAPYNMYRDLVLFQVGRLDGGDPTMTDRFFRVISDPRRLTLGRSTQTTLAVLVILLAVSLRVPMPRPVRFAAAWLGAIAIAFTAAPLHDAQYNTHLVPATAIITGWAVAVLVPQALAPGLLRRAAATVAVAVLALSGLQSARVVRSESLDRTGDVTALKEMLHDRPSCIFSFEAGWLIVADRLPDPDRVGTAAADPYVTGLIAANAAGEGHQLLGSPAAKRVYQEAVQRCPQVLLGDRGRWHLSDLYPWFADNYHRVAAVGPYGPDLWERNEGD